MPPFFKLSPTCQIEGLAALYEDFFGRKTDGFFVEVGAFDGESVSNTSGLADAGWSGIYVEPIKELCDRCALRHQNNSVEIVHSAIGDRVGTLELHFGGVLTTANPLYQKIYENTGWAKPLTSKHKTTVSQITLNQLLEERAADRALDLLVIDVEGHEAEVLKGFSISAWQPAMVIIEVEDSHESFVDRRDILSPAQIAELKQRFQFIRDTFQSAGYRILSQDAINTVYVRGDRVPAQNMDLVKGL